MAAPYHILNIRLSVSLSSELRGVDWFSCVLFTMRILRVRACVCIVLYSDCRFVQQVIGDNIARLRNISFNDEFYFDIRSALTAYNKTDCNVGLFNM